MNTVNLIPPSRNRARQSGRRTRRWYVGAGAYAVIVAFICLAASLSSGGAEQARSRLTLLESQALQMQADIDARADDIEQTRTMRAASRMLRHQPDWSTLTALLAGKAGDRIVLADVTFRAASPEAAAGRTTAADASVCNQSMHDYLLVLRGHARSQADVAQFAMRLEQTGLFDHVRIRKASRATFAGEDAMAFELDCGMIEGGGLRP